ncbi:MAG TPA: hypothetical protein VFT04_05935 [Gemmatimonadales bacterium]|nr:hypothetical protein [Gemmatimonadales bacterium]
MPLASRVFLRLALLHLVAGSILGAWLLGAKGGWPTTAPEWFRPAHVEMLLLGWLLNLIMGTAYWILPRHATGPARGRTGPVVFALVSLNAGVITAGCFGWLVAGRALEATAAAAFALHAWSRVRPSIRPAR